MTKFVKATIFFVLLSNLLFAQERKTVLLLAAMPEELKVYNNQIQDGRWLDQDVIVSLTGIGKVAAAMTTQSLISQHNPDYIIFTGFAGALSQDLQLGDLGIIQYAIDYEMDCTNFSSDFKRGEHPFVGHRLFTSDDKLIDLAMSANVTFTKFKGYVATGSEFVDKDRKQYFVQNISPDLESDIGRPNLIDMETSAVLYVAKANNVPALVMRVVSDTFDGDAPAEFNLFCKNEIQNYLEIVKYILRNI